MANNRSQLSRQASPLAWQPGAAPPATSPGDPQSTFDQALAFHRAGLLAEAELLYGRLLASQPRNFDCRHLLGVISYQRGDYEAALRQIDAALKINSKVSDAHLNRGNVLKRLKRFEEALASYDKAAALKHDDASILNARGTVLRDLKRFDEALRDLDAAISIKPDFVEAIGNRGNVYKDLERFDAALVDYDRAIALRPDNADTFNNRGNAFKELGRFDDALADYDRAIARNPGYAEARYNRGTTLYELGRFAEALAELDRAIAAKPDYALAYYNRGTTLMELKHIDDAIASFERAIALAPGHAEATWNRSLCNLLAGRYRDAWDGYEQRCETDQISAQWRACGRPRWDGKADLAGKTLVLHTEQGFGDNIMAARYVRRVAETGARVVLDAPQALAPLLATIEGIEIVTRGEALPGFDLHCPMMSLPRAFGTTLDSIPADVPYLCAPAARLARWRERLPQSDKPRIGINWAGNPAFKGDKTRSIGLRPLLPLLAREDVQFFSLQKDLRPEDADMLRDLPHIVPLGHEIENFADTAAIISQLDLVISSDTSVVHLAGALGKPVWILLQFVPDWRWLLDRDDSPWYPTARLFRQATIGDWSGVVENAAAALSGVARAPQQR